MSEVESREGVGVLRRGTCELLDRGRDNFEAHLDLSTEHPIKIIEDEERRRVPAGFVKPVLHLALERGYPFITVLRTVDVDGVCGKERTD